MLNKQESLKLYAVKDHHNQWRRAYETSGKLSKVYLFDRLSTAQAMVTEQSNRYPSDPIATIIEFELQMVQEIPQTDRINAVREKEKIRLLRKAAKQK